VTEIDVSATIADGLGGNLAPDTMTFDIIRRLVADMTMAEDAEMRDAILGLLEHEHLVAEGAGAAAVAALLAARIVRPGGRVAVILTGANIDVSRLREMLQGR
jgi:threonine dehydratase